MQRDARHRRLAGLGLVLISLLACGPPESPPTSAFYYQLLWAPETLDPIRLRRNPGVLDRIFDGLMRLDRIRKVPVPELAARQPTISEDGLVYEFELLPGARFHNGREIRASDFAASWRRLLDPENDSPKAWLLEPIAGAAEYHRGEADTIAGLEVEDPHRLRVRLEQPLPSFLYHLAQPATSVVPEQESRKLGREPVGSGPYRFVSWSRDGDELHLEAFDGDPRHEVSATPLIFQVLDPETALHRYQTGDLDLVSQLPFGGLRSVQSNFSSELRLFPGRDWVGFCFRCDEPPFADPRVRRAFALAVDREALVRELGAELRTAAISFLPQVVPDHDPELLQAGFDPDRARALLTEAGYLPRRGKSKEFPPQVFLNRMRVPITDFLVDSFRQLGVPVEGRDRDHGSPVQTWDGERFALFSGARSGEYPDPDPYLRTLFHSRGGSNDMGYENAEVDRLLDVARHETDPGHRRQLYRRAERLILDDAPCVVLYHFTEAILLRSKWSGIPIGYDPEFLEIERARLLK